MTERRSKETGNSLPGVYLKYRIALAVVQAAVSLSAAAAEPTFVTVTVDNDWFAAGDRHYTSGSHVAFARDLDTLPESVRGLPPFRWSADRTAVFAIGQRVYTPGNTNPKPGEPPDRPYAGWIYLQGDVRTQVGPVVDHLNATVGFIGPAAGAKQFQRIWHHILGSREFDGWDDQLRSEPTLSVGYSRAWTGLFARSMSQQTFDVSPYAGVTLGTPYTYANAGVVARFGRMLPDDLPVVAVSLGPPRDGFRGAQAFGWYAWGGVDARAVGRNTFLDGSTFRDSPSVDRKTFQYDVALGIVVAWPRARLGFSAVQRSREFAGQISADRYGQLAVSFAY
jgi:hypothetical protein